MVYFVDPNAVYTDPGYREFHHIKRGLDEPDPRTSHQKSTNLGDVVWAGVDMLADPDSDTDDDTASAGAEDLQLADSHRSLTPTVNTDDEDQYASSTKHDTGGPETLTTKSKSTTSKAGVPDVKPGIFPSGAYRGKSDRERVKIYTGWAAGLLDLLSARGVRRDDEILPSVLRRMPADLIREAIWKTEGAGENSQGATSSYSHYAFVRGPGTMKRGKEILTYALIDTRTDDCDKSITLVPLYQKRSRRAG